MYPFRIKKTILELYALPEMIQQREMHPDTFEQNRKWMAAVSFQSVDELANIYIAYTHTRVMCGGNTYMLS